MSEMIDEAFEALRELVLSCPDAFDTDVVKLFKDPGAPELPDVDAQTCKLALLSAPLWSELCEEHPSFLMEDFNDLCTEVVDEALEQEGLSGDQLVLIGKALLEGSQTHGLLMKAEKEATRAFEHDPTSKTVHALLQARLALGHYDECLPCLDHLAKEIDGSKETLIDWSMDLAQVLCERIPHRPILGEKFPPLLERFEAAFEANQKLERVEEEEFVLRWIRSLKFYLYHLESVFQEAQKADAGEDVDGDDEVNLHDEIAMDATFVEAEAEEIKPLVEFHDRLIMEFLDLFTDPLDEDLEPLQTAVQDEFYAALEKAGVDLDDGEEPVH